MADEARAHSSWVVRDARGGVVLMCEGDDAIAVADDWRQRGYAVEQVTQREVHAA